MKTKVALKYQPFKEALSQHSTSTVRLLPVFFRLAFPSQTLFVSVHRAPHLLCCRALEVQEVRLRTLRLASVAPCKRLQFGRLR